MDSADEAGGAAAEAMKPLDPRQIWVLRIRLAATLSLLLAAAIIIDLGWLRETNVAPYVVPAAALLLGLAALTVLPPRRYNSWGYAEGDDELHIRHGLWTRVRTAVPFARVQHIDVAQGPVERRFGLARLILHTAGTRSASIPLPGLAHEDAEAMRDRIRSKIRQDLM